MQSAAAPEGPLVYTRSGRDIDLTGKAWVGNTAFRRNAGEGGAALVHGERDYLIPVADLTLDGQRVQPERGDRITETINGELVIYEVTAPPDEPEARYSDHERTIWRVHCTYQFSSLDQTG